MTAPQYPYRDTLTGKIALVTEDAAGVFPHRLERVSDDSKPFEPGLFDSGTVDERAARRPSGDNVIDVQTIADRPATAVTEDADEDEAPAKSTTRKGK